MQQPSLIGRRLGDRYRVEHLLGAGAMGCVYRAVQDAEPTVVAIKVLQPEVAKDKTFLRRFHREARAASRLRHPNSVQVLDSGTDGDLTYLVMEFLEGRDLFEVLKGSGGRLPQPRAIRIAIQVCEALAAAHDAGIIHRDLKPENIMVLAHPGQADRDRVKVLDFGVAKVVEQEAGHTNTTGLTGLGGMIGTPEYMSPEQCDGRETLDGRSDLYACGVLLFRMVTGRVPFIGSGPVDTLLKQLSQQPPRPSSLVPGVSPALEGIILQALAKNPADRQESAAALVQNLSDVLDALENEPMPQTMRQPLQDEPSEGLERVSTLSNSLRSGATPSMPDGTAALSEITGADEPRAETAVPRALRPDQLAKKALLHPALAGDDQPLAKDPFVEALRRERAARFAAETKQAPEAEEVEVAAPPRRPASPKGLAQRGPTRRVSRTAIALLLLVLVAAMAVGTAVLLR